MVEWASNPQWFGMAGWFWLSWLTLFLACCLLSWRIR